MIPLWLFIIVCIVGTGWMWRRAWLDAKREERLRLLKGGPMPPLPRRVQRIAQRRYNESGARFPFGGEQ